MSRSGKVDAMHIHQQLLKTNLNYLGFLVVLISGSLCQGQHPGYIYVSNQSLNTVDVIRASDHVRVASVPTISTPYGLAITADGKRVYVSSFDGHTISAFDTETNALVSTNVQASPALGPHDAAILHVLTSDSIVAQHCGSKVCLAGTS
jgi:hypothetical protein